MITAIAPRHTGTPVAAVDSVTAARRTPVVQPATAPAAGTLAAWAARIDADGIGAHEDLARTMVTLASRIGLSPVLVDVLADPSEPSVARERAFGRLSLALTQIAA